MSYDTHYKITTEPGNILLNEVKQTIASLLGYSPFVDRIPWYDHEIHLQQVSQRFPHLLLVLDGEGEKAGDVWRKAFWNGQLVFQWKLDATPPPIHDAILQRLKPQSELQQELLQKQIAEKQQQLAQLQAEIAQMQNLMNPN